MRRMTRASAMFFACLGALPAAADTLTSAPLIVPSGSRVFCLFVNTNAQTVEFATKRVLRGLSGTPKTIAEDTCGASLAYHKSCYILHIHTGVSIDLFACRVTTIGSTPGLKGSFQVLSNVNIHIANAEMR